MADLRPKRIAESIEPFRVEPGRRVRLPRDFDPAGVTPGTASLSIDQWVVCIVVSLSLIVVEEVRKLLKVRLGDEATAPSAPSSALAAA